MDKVELVDVVKSIQNLLGHFLKAWNVEVMLLLDFAVVLGILVQVVSQQLCHDDQVFLVVKVVDHFQKVLFVQVLAVADDESQQLDFVNALVEVVFVVFDDLHAHHLFCVDVVALDRF